MQKDPNRCLIRAKITKELIEEVIAYHMTSNNSYGQSGCDHCPSKKAYEGYELQDADEYTCLLLAAGIYTSSETAEEYREKLYTFFLDPLYLDLLKVKEMEDGGSPV